jgi:hypothetical protein
MDMKIAKNLVMAAVVFFGLLSFAYAAQIPVASVGTDDGGHAYTNNPSLLSDGYIPPEGTIWTASTNVYWTGPNNIYEPWFDHPSFILDFGSVYRVDAIRVQVDNNDSYVLMASTNGSSWGTFYIIYAADGNIDPVSPGGMDPFDIAASSFTTGNPVDARYIKLFALSGDGMYAASEIQAFGTLPNGVPEPTTMLLLGAGILGLVGVRRLKK